MGIEDSAALQKQKRNLKRQKSELQDEITRLKKENVEAEKLKEEYIKMNDQLGQVEDKLEQAASNVISGYESFVAHNEGEFVNMRKAKMSGAHTQIKKAKTQASLLKVGCTIRIKTIGREIEEREQKITADYKKIEAIERKLRRINSSLSTM